MGKRCGLFELSMGLLAISLVSLCSLALSQRLLPSFAFLLRPISPFLDQGSELPQEEIVERIRRLQSSATAGRSAEDGFSNVSTRFVKSPSMDRPNDLRNALANEGGGDVSQWLGTAATARNLGGGDVNGTETGESIEEETENQRTVPPAGCMADLLVAYTTEFDRGEIKPAYYHKKTNSIYYGLEESDDSITINRSMNLRDTTHHLEEDNTYTLQTRFGNKKTYLTIKLNGKVVFDRTKPGSLQEEIVIGIAFLTKLQASNNEVDGIWKKFGNEIFMFQFLGAADFNGVGRKGFTSTFDEKAKFKHLLTLGKITITGEKKSLIIWREGARTPFMKEPLDERQVSICRKCWECYAGIGGEFDRPAMDDASSAKCDYVDAVHKAALRDGYKDLHITPEFKSTWFRPSDLLIANATSVEASSSPDLQTRVHEPTCDVTVTVSPESILGCGECFEHIGQRMCDFLKFYFTTDCWDTKPVFYAAVECPNKGPVKGLCYLRKTVDAESAAEERGRKRKATSPPGGVGKKEPRKPAKNKGGRLAVNKGGRHSTSGRSTQTSPPADDERKEVKPATIKFSIGRSDCTGIANTIHYTPFNDYTLEDPKDDVDEPKGSITLTCLS
eukprot:GHVS01023654.1.p1 GENE.GHVS01023654.1~~GHVS01023654.1.p1  ORF type:complete len:616 (+),score=56.72 GHVS01023654.1:303-2150(+)